MRKRFTAAIRDGSKPAVTAAQDAIQNLPFSSDHVGYIRRPASSGRGGGRRQRTGLLVERASTERAKTRAAKRNTGLRSTLARSVKVSITATGVQIYVRTTAVPGFPNAARKTDSVQGWRHPVFGRDVWVAERGGPWFASSIRSQQDVVRRSLEAAISETISRLS